MFKILAYLIVNALVILVIANLLPNFLVADLVAAVVFVLLLSIINSTLIPILKFLAFPFNFVTLGLVNGLISLAGIAFVVWLVPGIDIQGDYLTQIITILTLSIVLGLSSSIIEKLLKKM